MRRVDIYQAPRYNLNAVTIYAKPTNTIFGLPSKLMTVHTAFLADDSAGASTGIRVVEPPAASQQALRGSLFALVDLRGPQEGAAGLVDRLLSAMQRAYYTGKGTQSQVLADTVRAGKELLESEVIRLKMHWRAGIICIGLLPDRLAVAGMGDAFAFITTDGGDVNVYPPERLSPEFDGFNNALTLWPLHRQRVDVGGALMAGSGRWLQVTPARLLAGSVAFVDVSNYQDAADGLREQAGRSDLPGILLVFTNDAGGSPPPPPSSPPPDPPNQRTRTGALPTAVNASPPISSAPPEGASGSTAVKAAATAVAFGAPAPAQQAGTPPPVDEDAAETSAATNVPPNVQSTDPAAAQHEGEESSSGINTAALAGAAAAVAAGAKSGFGRLGSLVGSMLPDRNAEVSQASGAATINYTVPMVAPTRVTPIESPFTPPPRASGGRARLFVALAAVVLLLVPVVVAAMFWKIGAPDRADAAELLKLADSRYRSAVEALDQGDRQTGRKLLNDASDYVTQSEEKLGRTTQSSTLMTDIERELRDVMQVTPLYGLVQPLATFPAEADPSRLLVVDQDIYVLDGGRGLVAKYRLDAGGEVLEQAAEQVVLKQGDVINGVTVGQPIDLAWQMPIPGYEDKASLLVLDANNRVFRYSQVDGASLMSFGDPANWKQAQQVEVYLDRLYVGDTGANQIYRYDPGKYEDPPEPWFEPTTQVALDGMKVMRIDGDIWILYDDGKVVRYRAGEQVPYSLDGTVGLPTDAVDLYVSQGGDTSLYLADAADERVMRFDKDTGEFLGQYQAAEGHPLRGLRSIFVDEARGMFYALTDEALYQQRLPR